MIHEGPNDPVVGPGLSVGDDQPRGFRWCFCHRPSVAAGSGSQGHRITSDDHSTAANPATLRPTRGRKVLAVVEAYGPSRDGTGFGDCDREFVWGRPREFLTLRSQAMLTILRGYCMDTKRGGEPRNCATGDLAYTEVLESGLIVPR